MEQYTGIPYAFGKFDFVLIPAFQFGGMEHAGKILYNAAGLLLDESATQNQYLGRASVIAHETAHMWFGDLVTMRWFNDVWMKEVFANFMAAKIVNPSFPDVNHELRFLLVALPRRLRSGPHAWREPDPAAAGQPERSRQPLRRDHLSEGAGRDAPPRGADGRGSRSATACASTSKAHAFGNATWTDLIEVLDERTPADLRAWSRVWVEEPGRPTITTELDAASGTIARLAFAQRDTWKRGIVWPQQLRVTLGYADRDRRRCASRSTASACEAKDAVGMPAPLYVLPDWRRLGLRRRSSSIAASLDYLSRSLPDIADPLTRGAPGSRCGMRCSSGTLPPDAFMDLAIVGPAEGNRRAADVARAQLLRAAPGGDSSRRRSERERAATFETAAATTASTTAKTASQKAAWFGALRDVSP